MGSYFNDLFVYITQLMTTHAAMFTALGDTLFKSFSTIALVLFGVDVALGAAARSEPFPWDRFIKLILMLSLGLAMTRFYAAPIPGFDRSFYHIIIDQGPYLANQIEAGMVSKVASRLDSLYNGIEPPGLFTGLGSAVETLRWGITILIIAAAECAMFLIISLGYAATAVCVMLGPCFTPFFVFPGMEWVFWGWLRALMQYTFYPVVGSMFVYVFGNLLINYVDRAGTDLTTGQLAASFLPLLAMLVAFTWGLIKVPSICNSLFTGKSGESAIPTLG